MLQANSTNKGNKEPRSIHGGARDIATTDAYDHRVTITGHDHHDDRATIIVTINLTITVRTIIVT